MANPTVNPVMEACLQHWFDQIKLGNVNPTNVRHAFKAGWDANADLSRRAIESGILRPSRPAVDACVGRILDAWDAYPNDARPAIYELGLGDYLDALRSAADETEGK